MTFHQDEQADCPLVSVLIPCFNSQDYVDKAIESALGQDHVGIEVIVVDDGSTDRSLDVIKPYASDPRFRYETGPNCGGNVARNRLLQLARGDWIQYLDADDTLEPTKIRLQLAACEEGCDLVLCDILRTDATKTLTTCVSLPAIDGNILSYTIDHGIPIHVPLHRRSDLVEIGGFNEELPCCQEYDLHLRLALNRWNTVSQIHQPLCSVQRRSDSVSSSEDRVFLYRAKLLHQLYSSLTAQGVVAQDVSDAIARNLFISARHLVRHDRLDEAREYFEIVRGITVSEKLPVTPGMAALISMVGPVRAELLRNLAVKVLPVRRSRSER